MNQCSYIYILVMPTYPYFNIWILLILSFGYNEIDDFLEGKPLAQDSLKTILNLYNKTIHKRSTIPTIYD